MGKGRRIVDERLRWLAVLGGVLSTCVCATHILASQPLDMVSPIWKSTAVLAPAPMVSMVMACMSPATCQDDISPILERGMLIGSWVGAATSFANWFIALHRPNAAACQHLTVLPGLFMFIACLSVPLCGMRNPLHFWPAHRFSMITSGVLQLARTAAQVHALRLANVAAAHGLSELLPISLAAQCQAHPDFLPGGVNFPAALGFGCAALLVGLVLTPSKRMRLAILSGRFGSPAARVLNLGQLGPDELGPRAALPLCSAGKVPRPHHQGEAHQVRHRRAAAPPQSPPPHHRDTTAIATVTASPQPRPQLSTQPDNRQKCVIFTDAGGNAVESLHETTGSMTDAELEALCRRPYFHDGARWRSEDEVIDPLLRHQGAPGDGDGDGVESLHETTSSKSARSELEGVLRQDGKNENSPFGASGPLSILGSEPVSFPPAPPSSGSLSDSAHEERLFPPAPTSTASNGRSCPVEPLASGLSVEMVEQELAAMVNDEVVEAIGNDVLGAIERAFMSPPPPPPPPPGIGQLDAFAEVAKNWYGALSQLMRERERATGRDGRVNERGSATRPDQSEKKRQRSEIGPAMAESSSPLHGGGSSHVAAPPNPNVRPVDVSAVRPFSGKPHPNPLLANPRPMEPYPVFATGTSPGKPPPARACADVNSDSEPESSARGSCESRSQRIPERSRRAPQSDPAPSVGKAAGTALTEAGKPAKRNKPERSCAECGTTQTPKWRCSGTLCNACGLKFPMEARQTPLARAMELFQTAFVPGGQPFHAPTFPWSAKPKAERMALAQVPGK